MTDFGNPEEIGKKISYTICPHGFFLFHCLLSFVSILYTLAYYIDVETTVFKQLFIASYILIIIINMILGALVKPIHSNFSALKLPLFGLVAESLLFFWPLIFILLWGGTLFLNNYINKNYDLGILLQFLLSGYIIYTNLSIYM